MRVRRHPSPRRLQGGRSIIGLFVVTSVALFIGLFAFKVGPQYFEYWTVKQVAQDVAADTELLKGTRSQIHDYVNRAYRQNNLWDLEADETIVLTKHKQSGYVVKVQYEKRASLFANIDLVTSFDHTIAMP